MTHDFIPTAKAKRGKGPRTKKAKRKLRGDLPAGRAAIEKANAARKDRGVVAAP